MRAADVVRRRHDLQCHATADLDAIGAIDAHVVDMAAEARGLDRNALSAALVRREGRIALGERRREALRILLLGRELVRCVGALDIVHVDGDTGFIAEAQEARCRHGQRERIAHEHIRSGRAELAGAPRDGHEAHCAVEVGHVELGFGRTIRLDFDDAGEQRERLLDGRTAAHGHAAAAFAVTARAERSACRAHPVDEAAIEVADFDAETTLGVEVTLRGGRLEAREVQNAHIDGGDREACRFASFKAFDLHRHDECACRFDLCGRIQRELERFALGIEGEPAHADGTAWHALRTFVHGAIEHGRDISARHPLRIDRQRDLGATSGDVRILHGEQAARQHGEAHLAGSARVDAHAGGVASLIGRLVEYDIEHLGALGILARVPADIERHAREAGGLGIGARHFNAIAAPVERRRFDARRGSAVRCCRAVRDAFCRGDGFVIPLAVAAVPLPALIELKNFPLEGRAGTRCAFGIDEHRFEPRCLALADLRTRKKRLDADPRGARIHGETNTAFDRASALLAQAHDDLGFERLCRLRDRGQAHTNKATAVGTSLWEILQRLTHRHDLLTCEAELVSRKSRQITRCRANIDVAFHGETSRWRAVEIASVDGDGGRFLDGNALRLGLQRQRKALRQEVLDEEGGLGKGFAFLVKKEAGAPRSRHRGRGKRERRGTPAKLWFIEGEAAMLHAIRTCQDQRCRSVGCGTGAVTQQGD